MSKSPLKELYFSQLIPNIEEWPIAKFSKDRSDFASKLTNVVVSRIKEEYPDDLGELLEKTIYLENRRIKYTPWSVDPRDDKEYWSKLSAKIKGKVNTGDSELFEFLLNKIVTRYTEEILGHFVPKTHRFARKFLYRLFSMVFNKNYIFVNRKKAKLKNKLKLSGYVQEARDLFEYGTIVFVPTHYSNIDSILIGFILDYLAGFPASSYGAGLNLYDYEIPAYYMNRLGAYKIDRRKKNAIYKTNLLEMSSLSLQHGVNSLFFPGGGRSRNGAIEKHLKRGLLSSMIDAQRELIKNKTNKKIIIVPVTFGYHFVLEAKKLIEEYLKNEGRSKYMRSKKKEKGSLISLFRKFFSREIETYLRFGKPMDVLGFELNSVGESVDKKGDIIKLKGFFENDGIVTRNKQRESVYTKKLAQKIVESYHKNNVVLSSHLMAFIGFRELLDKYPDKEIYSIVNLPISSLKISKEVMTEKVEKYRSILLKMEEEGSLMLEPIFHDSIESLIEKGIYSVGIYHKKRPIALDKSLEAYVSEDFKLLFYYYNKLVNYNL